MGKLRMRAVRRKLAALLAAGMVFQTVQCTTGNEALLTNLIQTVGTVFITDYVNDLFGVTASPF